MIIVVVTNLRRLFLSSYFRLGLHIVLDSAHFRFASRSTSSMCAFSYSRYASHVAWHSALRFWQSAEHGGFVLIIAHLQSYVEFFPTTHTYLSLEQSLPSMRLCPHRQTPCRQSHPESLSCIHRYGSYFSLSCICICKSHSTLFYSCSSSIFAPREQ